MNSKIYKNDEESIHKFFSEANKYRTNNELCDWTLKTQDGGEFQVHKIILACSVKYFKSLFQAEMIDSKQDYLMLENISKDCLKRLLVYVYTGSIEINCINAMETFEKALYFGLKGLESFCVEFICQNINDENCVELWKYGEKFNDSEITARCIQYILNNAERLVQNPICNDLTIEMVTTLLSDQHDLDNKLKYSLFSNWMLVDFENRQESFNDLLERIDFLSLDYTFIESECVTKEKFMEQSVFVRKILQFYRNSVPRQKIACLLGGNLYFYNPITQSYSERKAGPSKIDEYYYAHTVFNTNSIFVCGGTDKKTCTRCCEYYCSSSNLWIDLPSMKRSRQNHSSTLFRDKIYVWGGPTTNDDSLETFDICSETWTNGKPMERNYNFSCCADNSCIYICYFDNNNLLHVHPFDPRAHNLDAVLGYYNNKKFVTPKAVMHDSKIYCFDSSGNQKIYDIRNNCVMPLKKNGAKRGESGFGVCTLHDEILWMGTINYCNYKSQIFSINENCWKVFDNSHIPVKSNDINLVVLG